MHMLVVKIIILVVVILLVVLFAAFVPLGLWISALASGVKIGVGDLIGMRLRRVAPKKIVMAMVKGTRGRPEPESESGGGAPAGRRQCG